MFRILAFFTQWNNITVITPIVYFLRILLEWTYGADWVKSNEWMNTAQSAQSALHSETIKLTLVCQVVLVRFDQVRRDVSRLHPLLADASLLPVCPDNITIGQYTTCTINEYNTIQYRSHVGRQWLEGLNMRPQKTFYTYFTLINATTLHCTKYMLWANENLKSCRNKNKKKRIRGGTNGP